MQHSLRTAMGRMPILLALLLLSLALGASARSANASPDPSSGTRQSMSGLLSIVGDFRKSYDPTPTSDYPYGVYTFSGTGENISDRFVRDIELIAISLSGENVALGCDGGAPAGAGCVIRVPDEALGDDGILSPGERFDVSVSIGLIDPLPFSYEYEVFGVVLDDEPGPEAPGMLLEGEPGSPALDAITTFNEQVDIAESDIGTDEAGHDIALTQIEIGLVEGATVAEVNDLLRSINGRIISMIGGVDIILVQIPNPGDFDGLIAVIAQVESHPAALFTNRAYFAEPDMLPEDYSLPLGEQAPKIGHHLAVGAHAAWNAQAGVASAFDAPVLNVIDYFGDGKPDDAINGVTFEHQYVTGSPDPHGYHVLGIIRGDFGGDTSDRGLVTGMYPLFAGGINVIDLKTGITTPQWHNTLIAHLQDITLNLGFNAIVNTSLGFGCKTPETVAAKCNEEYASKQAVMWIEKVRAAGLEEKVVHVNSAGNIEVAGDTASPVNDWFAAAAMLSGLQTLEETNPEAVPNLSNTLVVENLDWWYVENLPTPTCMRFSSKVGGNIAAIGTEVWSITDADSAAGSLTGTSMAAPQVAGLASLVWALNPELTAPQVVDIILETADPGVGPDSNPDCGPSASAPVLNAYAAVLEADLPTALNDGPRRHAPARMAILDVAGEGASGDPNEIFDESDIELFLSQFDAAPVDPDYSRYDLNGDRYTGGDRAAPFDLDIDGLHTEVDYDINGTTVTLNETAVTDHDILCYYAYSPLFVNDEIGHDARDELFLDYCLPSRVVEGNVTVTTNEEVAELADVEEITGTLIIAGFNSDSPITDLRPLQRLTSVGALTVFLNPVLIDLNGLDNLTDIEGNISIFSNESLTSLTGLEGTTGHLPGSLSIQNNPILANVDALIGITSVGQQVSVRANPALTDLNGLGSLTSIGNSLNVSGTGLESLGLNALATVGGGIAVQNSSFNFGALMVFELPALTQAGSLQVIDSTPGFAGSITSVSLPALTQTGGLSLIGLRSVSLNLPSLTSVTGGINIGTLATELNLSLPTSDVDRVSFGRAQPGAKLTLTVNSVVRDVRVGSGESFEFIFTANSVGLPGDASSSGTGITVDKNENATITLNVDEIGRDLIVYDNHGLDLNLQIGEIGRSLNFGNVLPLTFPRTPLVNTGFTFSGSVDSVGNSIEIIGNEGFTDDYAQEFADAIDGADRVAVSGNFIEGTEDD